MRAILIVLCVSLLSNINSFGQEDNGSKMKAWIPKQTIDYQYVYHFEHSETEYDFIFITGSNECIGQLKYGQWSPDGKSWIWIYKNLTNVRLDSNHLHSNETNGEFITINNGLETTKGLKLGKIWKELGDKEQYKVGFQSYPIKDYYSGKFTQASTRLLTTNDLKNLSKSDLKIMRNEIFARYGYKFKDGGEMDNYFSKQDWYSPQHSIVTSFLTKIEKANIKLIKTFESKK